MATRKQLQQQIADLDAEINVALTRARVPEVRLRANSFPSGNWGLTVIFLGWWLLGDMVWRSFHNQSQKVALLLGLAFGVFAVGRTLVWIFRREPVGISPEYREATERVKRLQDERRELQKQLKELDES